MAFRTKGVMRENDPVWSFSGLSIPSRFQFAFRKSSLFDVSTSRMSSRSHAFGSNCVKALFQYISTDVDFAITFCGLLFDSVWSFSELLNGTICKAFSGLESCKQLGAIFRRFELIGCEMVSARCPSTLSS